MVIFQAWKGYNGNLYFEPITISNYNQCVGSHRLLAQEQRYHMHTLPQMSYILPATKKRRLVNRYVDYYKVVSSSRNCDFIARSAKYFHRLLLLI